MNWYLDGRSWNDYSIDYDDGVPRAYDAGTAVNFLVALSQGNDFIHALLWRFISTPSMWPVSISDSSTAVEELERIARDADNNSPEAVWLRHRLVKVANQIRNYMRADHVWIDVAEIAWDGDGAVQRRARRDAERAPYLTAARIAKRLRAKVRTLVAIVERATGQRGVLGILSRQRAEERRKAETRARLDWLKEREWTHHVAATRAKIHGMHQIGDTRGYDSFHATLTLAPEYHAGGDRSPEEVKAEVKRLMRLVRGNLQHIRGEYVVDSLHSTRAAALARAAEMEKDPMWHCRTQKTGKAAYATLKARLIGKEIMALVKVEPHEVDGTPHIHLAGRNPPEAREPLRKLLRRLVPGERRAKITFARGDVPPWAATEYLMEEYADGSHAAKKARQWAKERGYRQVSWIGLQTMTTTWQAIYRAPEADLTLERARNAKRAMQDGRWGDALVIIGAVPALRNGTPRLRLVYESVTSAVGTMHQRAIGIVDPS